MLEKLSAPTVSEGTPQLPVEIPNRGIKIFMLHRFINPNYAFSIGVLWY